LLSAIRQTLTYKEALMLPNTKTIPLFPLDVVLFPGMVLPLNIFENRYRKMIRDCLNQKNPFGLIWTESEPVMLSVDKPLIGTQAIMTSVKALPDGRFYINTVGSERFVVRQLSDEQPYLVGYVESYPSLDANTNEAFGYLPTLNHLFQRYLKLLSEAVNQRVSIDPIPDDPTTLAFVVATLYQGQNWRKQELLSIESIPDLMRTEIELLKIENPLVEEMLIHREKGEMGSLRSLVMGSLAMYGLN